jgi:hypothetical protein
MQTNDLPAIRDRETIPAISEWQVMEQMAEKLHRSGFMPDSIKTPGQALAVIQLGRELGLPPMFSLRNIFVIGGKPSLNAQAMAAIIKQRVHPDAITVEQTTNMDCTVSYWRPTWKQRRELTFTMADAKTAGLLDGSNKYNWQKYPRNMLQARCISGVAIMEFQDVLGGIYTPEELGAPVDVDPSGTISVRVMDIERTTPPPATTEAPQSEPPARTRPEVTQSIRDWTAKLNAAGLNHNPIEGGKLPGQYSFAELLEYDHYLEGVWDNAQHQPAQEGE